eukprot:CAMPEP_0196666806 /NCGR_PEP_ID=MMETSP1086-20130531/64725_1 /TAXON_ID=77921 /ORGANISM="Cyanoptyche  gloeocystis , Strain SAG4.97" /LENGTH=260 /DNA_ID=CAMNT_0042004051 /DNA_START=110 /DNA_END=892 /DNA_ORIENTATION=-
MAESENSPGTPQTKAGCNQAKCEEILPDGNDIVESTCCTDSSQIVSDEGNSAEGSSVTSEKSLGFSTSTSPLDFSRKHLLQHRWTLYFDNPGKKVSPSNWESNLKKIASFDTVEDFWCIYNNIQQASRLAPGSNYHMFKDDVEPKWEDPWNENGGKWIYHIPPKQRYLLDHVWLEVLLALIGEQFDDFDDVCGVVVSLRRGADRLALWTRSAHNEELQRHIGWQLKRIVGADDRQTIGYLLHTDSMRKHPTSRSENTYEV